MFFRKVTMVVKSRGIVSLLFLFLYKAHLANLNGLGNLARRLRLKAKVDGTIIHLDSPFTEVAVKGLLVLGGYEAPERKLVLKYLPKDAPVIELGASLGVISCVVNHHLQHPKDHIVVEANSDLLPYLTQNRDANHCEFTIEHAAIAYNTKFIRFFSNEGSLGGSIYRGEGKSIQVPALTLQDLAKKVGFARFNLISDIEGSEIDLINHELDFLCQHVNWFVVELHEAISGIATVQGALTKLHDNGFELVQQVESTYCLRNVVAAIEETKKRPATHFQ